MKHSFLPTSAEEIRNLGWDRVDIVRIDSPLNKAIQPFSIARSSEFKHLSRRLFRKIANSPEAFEDVGFHFRLADETEDTP